MPQKSLYNRSSSIDARHVFEQVVPDEHTRTKLAAFLLDAVHQAEHEKPGNWSINLDPYGRFIKMNVGFLYCILIEKKQTLILCDRNTLLLPQGDEISQITFLGHKKRVAIKANSISEVPDCLARAQGSVGCVINTSIVDGYLEHLKKSNFDFIRTASWTHQFARIRNSHSPGMMEHLESIAAHLAHKSFSNKSTPQSNQSMPQPFGEILADQAVLLERSQKSNRTERLERLKSANKLPDRKLASVVVFNRNPDVIAEVLNRAKGNCEKCQNRAPFLKDGDGSAYLEVHHRIPLSEDGEDTVENAIALCPNCHRHAHYGKQTFTY